MACWGCGEAAVGTLLGCRLCTSSNRRRGAFNITSNHPSQHACDACTVAMRNSCKQRGLGEEASFQAGNLYVNADTAANQGGEIRGPL